MSSFGSKKQKSVFSSQRKQLLVKKMIFDPHEVAIPSSCYELRPINEHEENDQDFIFEPKSSSLKEISDFEKNSPSELYKMVYGHMDHALIQGGSPMSSAKSNVLSSEVQKQGNDYFSDSSSPLKRQHSLNPEEIKKYEKKAKMFQSVSEGSHSKTKRQKIYGNKGNEKVKVGVGSFKKQSQIPEEQDENEEKLEYQEELSSKRQKRLEQDSDEVKLEAESSDPIYIVPRSERKRKQTRQVRMSDEHELINSYLELTSYSSLLEEMICVYDKSPLFEHALDFDSDEDQTSEYENYITNDKKQVSEKLSMQASLLEDTVKLEQMSLSCGSENSNSNKAQLAKQAEVFSKFEKMRIQEADESNREKVIKQIKFEHTKTFLNFYEPIKELKPFVKKMSYEEKKIFLEFKQELRKIKEIIDYFDKKQNQNKKEHVCKICGQEFDCGRQLGGHMSRKHPGKAFEYGFKKELHRLKEIERNRRKYFKIQKPDLQVKDEYRESNDEQNKVKDGQK